MIMKRNHGAWNEILLYDLILNGILSSSSRFRQIITILLYTYAHYDINYAYWNFQMKVCTLKTENRSWCVHPVFSK